MLVGKKFGLDQWASTLDDVWGAETTNLSRSLVRTTGGTRDRSLGDRFADVKNVKDFGAEGDDHTDDTDAFQAAISAAGSGGTVFMPPGIYKITGSLNVQNKIGISFLGTGVETQIHGVFNNKAVFDCLGADRLIFKDFWLNGDATTYPDAGFLLSRPTTNASSGTHHFENVWTVGCWAKAALVGVSSEANTYVGGQFRNELSGREIVCIGATNRLNMTSAFATVPMNPVGGNTVHRFLGVYFAYNPVDRAAGANGVVLESIRDISFHGCFFQGAGARGMTILTGINALTIAGGETEWSGDYGIYIDANITVKNMHVTGWYTDRSIYGANGSMLQDSVIWADLNYEIGGTYEAGIDVYDIKNCIVNTQGKPITIRNSKTRCLIVGDTDSGFEFNDALIGRGTNMWTQSDLSNGEIQLNNAGTDSPGIHFYYGNNTNYGIDSSGSKLRISKNLDESGGVELATLDADNFTIHQVLRLEAASAWATAALGDGDVVLNDGGTTDTPGIHFYYADHTNFGIDVAGSELRFGYKLDETGGKDLLRIGSDGVQKIIGTGGGAVAGTATLVGGTVTVSTTAVKTGDLIVVWANDPGGTPGILSAPTGSITNGTSFIINSSSGTDVSHVSWLIIRPA
jgi:hypothetical protein